MSALPAHELLIQQGYSRLPQHPPQVGPRRLGRHRLLDRRAGENKQRRLDALAKATGRTKTFYAREAIFKHLDDLEDLYLAEKRLEDIRAGRTQPVPLEDVMKRYGVEG